MERDKLEDEYNINDTINDSPSPVLRTPSPQRAREKLVTIPSQAIKGNFLLAPWGEDARRAGEGLLVRGRLSLFNYPLFYEKINLNPNDSYESKCIGASP